MSRRELPALLTLDEVAELLRMRAHADKSQTRRRLVRAGLGPVMRRVGGSWLIDADDLRSFLASARRGPAPATLQPARGVR